MHELGIFVSAQRKVTFYGDRYLIEDQRVSRLPWKSILVAVGQSRGRWMFLVKRSLELWSSSHRFGLLCLPYTALFDQILSGGELPPNNEKSACW